MAPVCAELEEPKCSSQYLVHVGGGVLSILFQTIVCTDIFINVLDGYRNRYLENLPYEHAHKLHLDLHRSCLTVFLSEAKVIGLSW